ncbi:hypothetical protein U1Q18_036153 [Sarracenia purpurea var. burkii]
MPILKAKGEAEALCAQLNIEGQVDACITADSDVFLFGAHCVVKLIRPNSKEPFECYYISDVETGLGLKRKHLIAISLLLGNDYDLNGVQGPTTFSFSMELTECRLSEIGRDVREVISSWLVNIAAPSQARVAFKNLWGSNDRRDKEQKMNENWQMKVCQKIATEQNFPNVKIIEMYLSNNHCDFPDGGPNLAWENPKTEMLVDYLAFHQHWDPSYTRQRMLPILSTIFFREMASNPKPYLLYDQYGFDSIQRVKMRFGHKCFVVNWKKAAPAMNNTIYSVAAEEINLQPEANELDELIDPLDEVDTPQICLDGGCWYLSTDENIELVKAAFPDKVDLFFKEKELKEMKSRRNKPDKESRETPQNSESRPSLQLSIKEFYRSSKLVRQAKTEEKLAEDSENSGIGSSSGKRKVASSKLSKSVRRRLLFGS